MTNLTTTLEKSKELKLAGFNKEVEFWWLFSYATNKWALNKYPCDCKAGNVLPAPTITELLEELDNNTILQYENDVMVGLPVGDFIDLFRSPDKLADCWIFSKKEGLIK